jgi:hypothetical protein
MPAFQVAQACVAMLLLCWRVLGVDAERLPGDWPFAFSIFALAASLVRNERAISWLALGAGAWLTGIHLWGQLPLAIAALRQGSP